MLERIKQSLDEAYQGIRKRTSKITLRAEEKAKLTRISMQVKSLQKELDGILRRLGNRIYNFREERREGDLLQDAIIQEILKEADRVHGDMLQCRMEMDKIREDFESRIQAVTPIKTKEGEAKEAEKTVEAGRK
ncbi:MAG: hypothetical protein GXP58_01385 [Deltaproteobacteria bacterium]|nr:hypothetical protein [Deltaproteobacteria bacterium]